MSKQKGKEKGTLPLTVTNNTTEKIIGALNDSFSSLQEK